MYFHTGKIANPWVHSIIPKEGYITGHIDFIQYRFGWYYIVDYKPNAEKEKPLGQLFLYACGLKYVTGIPFKKMRLAWFDEKVYYECDAEDVYNNCMNIGNIHAGSIL